MKLTKKMEDGQKRQLEKRLEAVELEIKEIKREKVFQVEEKKWKGQMITDEKKQERKSDEFDAEFRRFEEQMKKWRVEFDEKVKNYQWEINYQGDVGEGEYKGRGVNGKPDGLGILENEQYRV